MITGLAWIVAGPLLLLVVVLVALRFQIKAVEEDLKGEADYRRRDRETSRQEYLWARNANNETHEMLEALARALGYTIHKEQAKVVAVKKGGPEPGP
jgi:hypothetical protein